MIIQAKKSPKIINNQINPAFLLIHYTNIHGIWWTTSKKKMKVKVKKQNERKTKKADKEKGEPKLGIERKKEKKNSECEPYWTPTDI